MRFFKPDPEKYKNFDFWFPRLSLIFLFLCFYLLYLNFNDVEGAGRNRVIGKIYYKNKVAQRKLNAQVIWNEVKQGAPVYNHDTLRTEDLSEAVVELSDGTHIEMDQNSMIVLIISEKKANIQFQGGSIRARNNSENAGDVKINIVAGDKIVKTDGNGDIQLIDRGDNSLVLNVKSGEAVVENQTDKKNLEENQLADVKKDAISVQKIDISLIEPKQSQKYFTKSGSESVHLKWSAKQKSNIEIATDIHFKEIVKSSNESGEYSSDLKPGKYYWRVFNPDDGGISETRTFQIIGVHQVDLFSPGNAEVIQYRVSEPLVHFSWTSNEFAKSYLIEVARDEDFKNKIYEDEIVDAANVTKALGEGQYFWRIKSIGENEGSTSRSRTFSFRINKSDEKIIPQIFSPQENSGHDRIAFLDRGIVFNWKEEREVDKFILEISDTRNFETKIFEEKSSLNFMTVKKELIPGKYYFRVRGIQDKKFTEYSKIISFNVLPEKKLALIYPEDNGQLGSKEVAQTGVKFTWESYEHQGMYRITVSKNSGFQNPVQVKDTKNNFMQIDKLSSDQYFWKISYLGESKKIITESNSQTFTVYESMPDPDLIYPKSGTSINVSDAEELKFKFTAVPDAEIYEITIHDADTGRIIFSQETKKNEVVFKNINTLQSEHYYWNVQAKKIKDGKLYKSKHIQGNFNIELEEIPYPEIKF